ncbi:MAG: sigma-70 family RNA polymerase sigma factor [Bifidobacteriaceae bacterium]|nr:sigma-70 family RNA polymerase sigma factor [Bifidobacteriaceae bacterium]
MRPDDRLAISPAPPAGAHQADHSHQTDPEFFALGDHLEGDPGARSLVRTETAVERHGAMVFGVAVTHTACRGDAEDVFQEVFLAYHRTAPRCRDEEHRKAWLLRTTLNIARRLAASSWRTRVVPLTADDPPAATAVSFTFASERQDAIFRALATLPEATRTVLHLFYFEDLPVAEIASLLDIEPGAVKMRLSRGRADMRDRLRGELFDD